MFGRVVRWVERRLGPANIMRGGLSVETLSHLVLALTVTPAIATVGCSFMMGSVCGTGILAPR